MDETQPVRMRPPKKPLLPAVEVTLIASERSKTARTLAVRRALAPDPRVTTPR